MKHILSVLVENKPGVLSRVTGLISRRGFNIESLSVGPTEDPTMSRVTAIVKADDVAYEQITKQLHKLISVHKITDLTNDAAIERELVLFKVNAQPDRRNEIIEIANVFRAKIVDVGPQLADHRGHGRREQAQGHGGPLPRLWHQGDHPHRQDSHVPKQQGRVAFRSFSESPSKVPSANRKENEHGCYDLSRERRESAAHPGQEDRHHRLRKPGPRPCAEPGRFRMRRAHRAARGFSFAGARPSRRACR